MLGNGARTSSKHAAGLRQPPTPRQDARPAQPPTCLDAGFQALKLGRDAKEVRDGHAHRQALVHAAAAWVGAGQQLQRDGSQAAAPCACLRTECLPNSLQATAGRE